MAQDFSRLSSRDPSEFFVDAATPTLGGEPTRLARAITMGASNAQIDFLETAPEIKLTLLSKKLLFYCLTTLLFYGAFTIVAFIGVPVETVYEDIGTSKKAEDRVEIYNTYSGYLMAFIETLTGMYMDKFMPVLDVYVHNTLYFLQKASSTIDPATGQPKPARKFSRKTHEAILFFFPIVLALTMGNSLRGFQAGSESDGFKHIMTTDDLKKEQPTLELIKEAAVKKKGNATTLAAAPKGTDVQDTILRNAVRERSSPFMFDTKSPCGDNDNSTTVSTKTVDKAVRTIALNVHELDATSAVYGFVPQEWNGEALTNALAPDSTFHITYKDYVEAATKNKTLPVPTDFSITTAFEILIQGQLLIERAYGDAATDTYPCTRSDSLGDKTPSANAAGGTSATPTPTTKSPTMPKPATAARAIDGARLPATIHKHVASRRRRLQAGSGSAAASDVDAGEDVEGPEPDNSLNQWTIDENYVRQCQGAVSSLFDMFDFDNRAFHTMDNLMGVVPLIINKTIGHVSIEETEITLEKYKLTDQIHAEAMRIDITMDPSVQYGLEEDCPGGANSTNASTVCNDYTYDTLGESFCGSNGCAFLDQSDTLKMQRQIGIVPYVVNCTLDAQHVHYSADFRGFYPSDCVKVAKTALLYGIGSYITGDEYGSNDTRLGTHGPYILAPRRHVRFTFAKVTWQTEDLAAKYNAHCGTNKDKANCNGLAYQLKPSNRYLFAGEDALPTQKLAAADFRSPISLVQLNSPTLYIPKLDAKITLEPLNPNNFKRVKWDKKPYTVKAANGTNVMTTAALHGDQCSVLVDSYLRQVSENQYAIEQPLQVMYTSFFYYFMQNAAVTELNDTKLAINGTLDMNKTSIALSKNDKLGNVKLKGDMQVRSIRVSIPKSSFQTSAAGCGLILILTLLVICVRARRVEFFDDDATVAQEFIAMGSDEAYPDSVHKKMLQFPATNEVVAFDELEVERLVLVHETDRDKKVYM